MGLVLSRKLNQVIRIGGDVSLTVIGVRGETVRLLVDAPSSVEVHRQEVLEAIERERLDTDTGPE